MFSEPPEVAEFRGWLTKNDAYVHPDLRFVKVDSGMSIYTVQDIPSDTKIVSCPFSLAVTPGIAKSALAKLLNNDDLNLNTLSERGLICTYLIMHWIMEDPQENGLLESATDFIHLQYLRTLPPVHELRTAVHFTEKELSLLKGTNLFGATVDRRVEWEIEWKRCQEFVGSIQTAWRSLFTWERYLTVSTYLSSRAFPSTLLSNTPSLVSVPSSHPVLLPGIDSLNHSRAHQVSWLIDDIGDKVRIRTDATPVPTTSLQVSLVIHRPTQANTELFNNYGPKPNAELVLGYGFSLPSNPDDSIVLKIGGKNESSGLKWEIGRDAQGADGLWEELKNIVSDGIDGEISEWEVNLETAETLKEMIEVKLTNLPQLPVATPAGVRVDVFVMITDYVLGQKDILQSLLEFADTKREYALTIARDEGVELFLEEDGDE